MSRHTGMQDTLRIRKSFREDRRPLSPATAPGGKGPQHFRRVFRAANKTSQVLRVSLSASGSRQFLSGVLILHGPASFRKVSAGHLPPCSHTPRRAAHIVRISPAIELRPRQNRFQARPFSDRAAPGWGRSSAKCLVRQSLSTSRQPLPRTAETPAKAATGKKPPEKRDFRLPPRSVFLSTWP